MRNYNETFASEKIKETGGNIIKGFMQGIQLFEKERIANNYNKMHGIPLRRKKSRKDDRPKIRRNIIASETFAKKLKSMAFMGRK